MNTAVTEGAITVRNQMSETGDLPRAYSAGSPDIIVSGTTPLDDPAILEKPENYGNGYNNLLYIGLPNYLYVRGKNYGTSKVDGTWSLFWSTPNILMLPYLWEKNQLATSDGNMTPPFSIEAGAIGASTNAFTWVPPGTDDHYCMIGIAESPDHPNPLKGVRNVSDLAATMASNGNIAQRNLQLIRGNVPQVVSQAGYNQGEEAERIDIAVVIANLPKGSAYTVGSGTPLDGRVLFHSETKTTSSSFKYAWTDLDVPAQWSSLFNYTMTFGTDWSDIPDDGKPELTIRGEIVMSSEHRLYHHPAARLADPDPLTGAERLDRSGGPVKVMTAGTVKTICPDIIRR